MNVDSACIEEILQLTFWTSVYVAKLSDYYGTIGEPQLISDHEKLCLKYPVHCPNSCDAGIMYAKDMVAHRKECPLEMVLCEYHNVGCEERMMRKSKKEHEKEQMEKHLLLNKYMLNNLLQKNWQ